MTDIITSIARQESALARILNAEAENMQKVIDMDKISKEELVCVNKSIELMIDAITRLEMILQAKLEIVAPQSRCIEKCPHNECER